MMVVLCYLLLLFILYASILAAQETGGLWWKRGEIAIHPIVPVSAHLWNNVFPYQGELYRVCFFKLEHSARHIYWVFSVELCAFDFQFYHSIIMHNDLDQKLNCCINANVWKYFVYPVFIKWNVFRLRTIQKEGLCFKSYSSGIMEIE